MSRASYARGLHRILSRSPRQPRTKGQILTFACAMGMLPECAEEGLRHLIATGELVENLIGQFELKDRL